MLGAEAMKDIVRLGGGLDLKPVAIGVELAKDLARIAKTSGATVVFRNPTWGSESLKDIARLSGGRVIFRYD